MFAQGALFAAMQVDSLQILSHEAPFIITHEPWPFRNIHLIFVSIMRSILELSAIIIYFISISIIISLASWSSFTKPSTQNL